MHTEKNINKSNSYDRQRGVALLILLLILGSGAVYALLRTLNQNNLQIERGKKTADALAQAKQALLGYTISMSLLAPTSDRPGDLPCPALSKNGIAGTMCGDPAGNNQSLRLGLLPWKTLKLPDLRDGYGEQLWYAVSNNFKKNQRRFPLNSDTYGTITVKDSSGNILHDGRFPSGAVAVIIAPGPPISRQGGTMQIRTNATATAINYLDNTAAEDNAEFIDGSDNGFIQGNVLDSEGNKIINDRLSIITYEEIMPLIEKRVASEIRYCLTKYAANNGGLYPWAAGAAGNDQADTFFGRLPAGYFLATRNSNISMNDRWVNDCVASNFTSSPHWWTENSWQDHIFYALAPAFSPTAGNSPSCGACLNVTGPQTFTNKQFVVMVAGKAFPSQLRATPADKANFANYLEGENLTPNNLYFQGAPSATFNDRVVFYPK